MRLGIYIGSFNPPHKGHIHVVNYLINNRIVDKVLIVPTKNYWDKQNLVDINDRINMLTIYKNNNIMIDNNNNGYSYTYELMRKLKKDYLNDELFLIIGADNIVNFDKWKNYEELLEYKIIIMNRNGINIREYTKKYPNGNFIIMDKFKEKKVSSTDFRNKENIKLFDKEVIEYIEKHHLYDS